MINKLLWKIVELGKSYALVAGDFNYGNIDWITRTYKSEGIVNSPTRAKATDKPTTLPDVLK